MNDCPKRRDNYCFGVIHVDNQVSFFVEAHFYLLIHKKYIMHFGVKLEILAFKVIADLIGLYLVAFQNNMDSDMGNAFQACFFTAGLNVLLQCAVCPQFLCPAQVVRFRACNIK